MASIVIDFERGINFYESFNKIWDYTDMDGVLENSPFYMVLASDCDDVFEKNVDSSGNLDYSVVTVDTNFKVRLPLDWKVAGNNSRDIAIAADTTLSIGDPHHDVKAVFLIAEHTVSGTTKDYVIAHMVLPYYLTVTNEISFPKDTVLVSVE